jgi:hypothetical protein
LNYHDPDVPLQKEDVDYYRYHPLLLNAAFLGYLSEEDHRILGFGDKRNYVHAFIRQVKFAKLDTALTRFFGIVLRLQQLAYIQQRIYSKLKRVIVGKTVCKQM